MQSDNEIKKSSYNKVDDIYFIYYVRFHKTISITINQKIITLQKFNNFWCDHSEF